MTVYDLPGTIKTSFNFAVKPVYIWRQDFWSLQFFPDEKLLSSYDTNKGATPTNSAAPNENNGRSSPDDSAEPRPPSSAPLRKRSEDRNNEYQKQKEIEQIGR
jgi:hypothetical protein